MQTIKKKTLLPNVAGFFFLGKYVCYYSVMLIKNNRKPVAHFSFIKIKNKERPIPY